MKIKMCDLYYCKYFQDSKVLAGEKGLTNLVTSVQVLESIRSQKFLRGGELLLTSGYTFLNNHAVQAELISGLYESGAAGLCVDLELFIENRLPPIMEETANSLDFPIISFPSGSGYFFKDICDFASSHLFSPITKKFKKTEEVFKEINEEICKYGLNGLLKSLYIWTGLKVAILFEGELLSYPDSNISESLLNNPNNWHIIEDAQFIHTGFKLFKCEHKNQSYEWIGVKILGSNLSKSNNYLMLFKNGTNFNNVDLTVLPAALSACSIEIKRLKNISEIRVKYRKDIFDNLLTGNIDFEEARYQANYLGFDLNKQGSLVLIKINHQLINQDIENESKNINAILEYFLKVIPLWIKLDEDCIAIYMSKPSKDLMEKIYKKIQKIFPDPEMAIGVSRETDISYIQKSLHEAQKALDIGRSIHSKQKIHYFKDLGIYRIINLQDKDEIWHFYTDYIKPLEENFADDYFDSMIETLENYIQCGFSYVEVAKKIHLHRNTVKYRISMIEKRCGIDLQTYETRLNMALALKLLPVMKQLKLKESLFKKEIN